jgi:hypothetical protein
LFTIGLQVHRRLLERFIKTYRYINPDIRLAIMHDLPQAETPVGSATNYIRQPKSDCQWRSES